ncbi:ABC transporter substrate-binding protein [Corynebacterium sp. LK19]|uniref:ABC transporter substrate-binding protein n=1 Tax=unclassified Corynebacterium TaxID=2624378 RepID=UPI0011C734A9|nr:MULTISPECIES: ABC transporter substrate-binding protein [unclassified Corynebacterium]MBC6747551.1 ABC transporter substrate-binding protein [Corynebacterium sp. LK25]TXS60709.1 ABC transporter substrate-binding protein [Corynebacterium sp. LK19]TXS82658.1 ABC transporter substrate-binding protein [Corynebacterium sp. LK10]
MNRKIGLILATAALPFGLASCFAQGSGDADALRVALQFEPVAEFSPYSDDAVLSTRAGATEMLVAIDDEGTVKPELTEKWEVKDARTVVFTLPDGLTFHDGTPVDAQAVANSLTHAIDAPTRPKGLGKNQLQATATGDREVTVTSDKDDPILVKRFADPGTMILSPAAFEGDAPDPFGHGTGPFELETKNPDGTVSARAFADYRNGKPETETLTLSFIGDSTARTNALRADEQDLVKGLPISSLGGLDDVDVSKVDLPRVNLLHFNTAKGVFADAELRKEVAAAIDPEPVVRDIFEAQAVNPKGSIFNRSASWAAATPETTVKPGPNGKGKEIRLATWDSRAELPEVANLVADQLRKMGFTVDITVADYNSLEADMLEGNFDVIVGSRNYMLGAADPISFLQSDFTCESSYNLSQLCNQTIDVDIEKAAELGDDEERLSAAARIGAEIVADGAVVPLSHEKSLIGAKNVRGIALDPMERHLITEKTAK